MLIQKLKADLHNKSYHEQREHLYIVIDTLIEESEANLKSELAELKQNMDKWQSPVYVTLDYLYTKVILLNKHGYTFEEMETIIADRCNSQMLLLK